MEYKIMIDAKEAKRLYDESGAEVDSYLKTLFVALAVILAGCSPSESEKLSINPRVSDVGVFEGCAVKHVNRGNISESFYIARCGDTVTTTSSTGSKYPRNRTVITREIEALQTELSTVSKEEALAKLTPAERKVLGVTE